MFHLTAGLESDKEDETPREQPFKSPTRNPFAPRNAAPDAPISAQAKSSGCSTPAYSSKLHPAARRQPQSPAKPSTDQQVPFFNQRHSKAPETSVRTTAEEMASQPGPAEKSVEGHVQQREKAQEVQLSGGIGEGPSKAAETGNGQGSPVFQDWRAATVEAKANQDGGASGPAGGHAQTAEPFAFSTTASRPANGVPRTPPPPL